MSLSINDFKAKLIGGGARANLMRVNLYFPNGAIGDSVDQELAQFMIKGAQLPGRNINPIPIPFRGREFKVTGDTVYEDWTVTVINDNNFAVRNAMERWQDSINNAIANRSVNVDASDFNSYTSDLEVEQLGRNGDVIKRYVFRGAWPTAVDPIEVGFDQTDTIEEFGVTFSYQWWESDTTGTVGGAGGGAPSGRTTAGVNTPSKTS